MSEKPTPSLSLTPSIPGEFGNHTDEAASEATAAFHEGGIRGWLAVLGGAVVIFTTLGNIQAFGVYQDYYTRIYFPEKSTSAISWIGSVQQALQFVIGVFSGILFDRGHFHPLMLSGSFLILGSLYALSFVQAHHYYQALLSHGFAFGIGCGLVFTPSLGIISHYFKKRRAVAMGILISSGSLGGIVFSILLNKILPRTDLGFPWAVRFIAFIDTFLLAVANLIMRPRPLGRASAVDMTQLRRDVPYWTTNMGLFLAFLGLLIPYFYLQLFSFVQGINADFLTWTIPILNAGAFAGRLVPSFFADVYGPLNILLPCGFISGALVWALLGVRNIAGMTFFALIYGFTSGAFLSLASPAVAAFSTSPSMDDVGLRIGISAVFIGLALLAGNPIAGALLGSSPLSFTWWRPLLFGSVVMITGSTLILYARQAVVKRRGSQRV
ncbi:MFS general substrate transporter [Mycena galericulata]|nr:MFS general substrate transporter [Mycena galericulata]